MKRYLFTLWLYEKDLMMPSKEKYIVRMIHKELIFEAYADVICFPDPYASQDLARRWVQKIYILES